MEDAPHQASDTNARIWECYFESSVQQLAFNTIITEILKGDLTWVQESDNDDSSTPIEEFDGKPLFVGDQWVQFVRSFVLHLHLFGYVVYRLAPNKRRLGMLTGYEIAPATAHFLQHDGRNGNWRIQATENQMGHKIRGSKLWNLSILSPPIEYGSTSRSTIQPTSSGFKSVETVDQLNEIEEMARQRDKYNSIPTVFTQVSKSLSTISEGKKPWFRPAALPNYENTTAPDAPQDFNALVEDRAEAIQRLDEISERARQRARQMYENNSAQQHRVGNGLQKKEREVNHRELVVSDGREAQPASFLRAPENIEKIIQKHEHRIMFNWNVPPQVLGQNINSERTAASNRLSDMAISGFDAHIKIVRGLLQDALRKLTILISKNTSVYIQCKPCVSAYSLTQLEGILRKEACADMYSCVYQIPRQFLDLDALVQRQQTINNSVATKTRVEQSSSSAIGEGASGAKSEKSKNRPAMTQQQKDQRSISKSKAPTT